MSYGRAETPPSEVRDIDADFEAAYRAEYESYRAAGDIARAEQVAAVLDQLGHKAHAKVPRPVEGDKETAVSPEPVETAVEEPKRRGRPRKHVEEAPEAE